MIMLKKIIVFILLFMFIVPIVGCGNNNNPDAGVNPPSPQNPIDENANFGDPVVPEKEIV